MTTVSYARCIEVAAQMRNTLQTNLAVAIIGRLFPDRIGDIAADVAAMGSALATMERLGATRPTEASVTVAEAAEKVRVARKVKEKKHPQRQPKKAGVTPERAAQLRRYTAKSRAKKAAAAGADRVTVAAMLIKGGYHITEADPLSREIVPGNAGAMLKSNAKENRAAQALLATRAGTVSTTPEAAIAGAMKEVGVAPVLERDREAMKGQPITGLIAHAPFTPLGEEAAPVAAPVQPESPGITPLGQVKPRARKSKPLALAIESQAGAPKGEPTVVLDAPVETVKEMEIDGVPRKLVVQDYADDPKAAERAARAAKAREALAAIK